jgi:hypothetical protein
MQFYVTESENKTETHCSDHNASLEKGIGRYWCASEIVLKQMLNELVLEM